MLKKQTSDNISILASNILSGRKKATKQDIKSLAASVLCQDETKGKRRK